MPKGKSSSGLSRFLGKATMILAAAFALGLQQCAPAARTTARKSRPNVVLVLADDLGYGDLGCYGAPDVRTPGIDLLAGEGVRFTDFYANSPLCSPTRSALLSGLYPQHAGVWKGIPARKEKKEEKPRKERNLGLREDVRLLPEILSAEGYACGIFGKWHLGNNPPNLPNDRGFDSFFGFLGGSSRYGPEHGPTQRLNREPHDETGHLTDLFTDKACAFIRENRDRPFFLYVPYNAPHGPIDNAASLIPDYVKRYEAAGVPSPRARYCAVVEHLDAGVARILRTLEELGLDGDTLVVFTSDNGADTGKWQGSNRPLSGEKGQVFEGGIRVPCVVRWPGRIPSGSVIRSPAISMDLFSTILEAAGIEPPSEVDGLSLLGMLTGKGERWPTERFLFFELKGRVAVRCGKWKLVGDLSDEKRRDRFALYDLERDPGESRDLSAEHPEERERLRSALLAWLSTFEKHRGLK